MRLRLTLRASMLAMALSFLVPGAAAAAPAPPAPASQGGAAGCRLPSSAGVRHVVYVQFDNVHLRRDDPNVPSDVEQMPNLRSFIQDQGVLSDNHHTSLISHTANGFLGSITGLYPDQQGQAVSNSYRQYVNPDGTTASTSSFAYWTNPTPDGSPNLLTSAGTNTPAPWVPFTRAGCNVGEVGMANTVLEGNGDVAKVFGPRSPEAAEASSGSPNTSPDFVGVAVHCASGAALCAAANHGAPDLLPQEPGGYAGFNALYGHRYVVPQIAAPPLKDLDGNVIGKASGGGLIAGFPGFDGLTAPVSLAYTAAMQEHGVPITYTYISDAHVDAQAHDAGPGQVDYVNRLRTYDRAFGTFFSRLKADGITRDNTLFVVTVDENDHFIGGAPSPAGCDGVHVPCTYAQIGEIAANLSQLMRQAGSTTPFAVHADSAPAIWLNGQPAPDAAVTRTFERTLGGIRVTNPLRGRTDLLVPSMVDPVGMGLLHMVTADPRRTPTMVAFANEDYFLSTFPPPCSTAAVAECPGFAWNHGDIQPDITRDWIGMVGPGVRHLGRTSAIWSDLTDDRPTILLLAGLRDDYTHEGRPLIEMLRDSALPASLRAHRDELLDMMRVMKRIDAPVGELGLDGVAISTAALNGTDQRYARLEAEVAALAGSRDPLVGRMRAAIDAAAFSGRAINPRDADRLTDQGRDLLELGRDEARAAG
jgi:hypothetical protein